MAIAIISKIYLKIFRPTQPSIGTTNSGGMQELFLHWWPSYMDKCVNKLKKAKWTTLLIIDSQAVKNTCNASVESKSFWFYKCTNGIKRHLAVDTRLLSVFYPLYESQCLWWPRQNPRCWARTSTTFAPNQSISSYITILLDNDCHPEVMMAALQDLYPQIMTKIRFELVVCQELIDG